MGFEIFDWKVIMHRNIFKFFNFIFLFLIFSACEKKEIFKDSVEKKITVQILPKDIEVPSHVWDLLESKAIFNLSGQLVSQETLQFKFEENVFIGATVRLLEKTPGILGPASIEIHAPRAGLEVDLANYIKLDKGTFILTFKPDLEIKPEQMKVYFISRSKIRKSIVGQSLGSGCNKFYDVTDYFRNIILKEGIEINVTEGRHISLLGGHFIFLASQEGAIRALTQITFIDSVHPQYLCNEKKEET